MPNEPRNGSLDTTADVKNNMPATTTAEQDRHSLGQRDTNMHWEWTQSILAILIIVGALVVVIFLVIYDHESRGEAFTFLVATTSTVIGFYFGRTNHTKVGGVDLGR